MRVSDPNIEVSGTLKKQQLLFFKIALKVVRLGDFIVAHR